MTVDLSGIKLYSEANFANVSSTDDDKLYFVEDSGGAITEYSSGTSGYLIFPSGMCIQWGRATISSANTPVTAALTKTYTNTNYVVLATLNSSTYGTSTAESTGYANTTSQIKVGSSTKNSIVNWVTIGQLASGQY